MLHAKTKEKWSLQLTDGSDFAFLRQRWRRDKAVGGGIVFDTRWCGGFWESWQRDKPRFRHIGWQANRKTSHFRGFKKTMPRWQNLALCNCWPTLSAVLEIAQAQNHNAWRCHACPFVCYRVAWTIKTCASWLVRLICCFIEVMLFTWWKNSKVSFH